VERRGEAFVAYDASSVIVRRSRLPVDGQLSNGRRACRPMGNLGGNLDELAPFGVILRHEKKGNGTDFSRPKFFTSCVCHSPFVASTCGAGRWEKSGWKSG
jgi:hypothetical protein